MIGSLALIVAVDPQDVRSKLIDDAGPVAGLFVLLLGIGMFLLWRSMTKQLKRINPDLPAGRDGRLQARDRAITQEPADPSDPDADESSLA